MTTFLLIRHALHGFGGDRIAGRIPNVRLSPDGEAQAVRLAEMLRPLLLEAVYSSPMERTRQTASVFCKSPLVAEELNELDFGDWQGKSLDELRTIDGWGRFNSFRSGTRAPQGELMIETQLRIVRFMTELRARHPNGTVALVSHGDVIRSAVAYFLGIPLDLFQRIEIDPASVTVVAIADYGPWVLGMNYTGALPSLPSS